MSPAQRLRHDHKVRKEAVRLLAHGYSVRARVEGWLESPREILGYRPDIIAQKDNAILIVEVKKGSVDWPKIVAFHRYADKRENCDFRVEDS